MDNEIITILGEKLGALRGHYLIQLSEKMKTIEIIRSNCAEGPIAPQSLSTLKTIAHQLAGGGGTYGFPTISQAAGELDRLLQSEPPAPPPFVLDKLNALYNVCRTAIDQDLSGPVSDEDEDSADDLPLVAIVDDDPMLRLAYKNVLAGKARLIMGKDTNEARAILKKEKPALLILDDIMPGGPTGLSFLEGLKNDPEINKPPVIMVTASSSSADVLRGLSAGAVDYIIKPFVPEKLLTAVMAVLSRRRPHMFLALKDSNLCQTLTQRLSSLNCDVVVASPDGSWVTSVLVPANCFVLFDDSVCLDVPSFMAQNALATLLYLGQNVLTLKTAVAFPLFSHTAETSAEEIVRRLGLLLAARKRAGPSGLPERDPHE